MECSKRSNVAVYILHLSRLRRINNFKICLNVNLQKECDGVSSSKAYLRIKFSKFLARESRAVDVQSAKSDLTDRRDYEAIDCSGMAPCIARNHLKSLVT